MRVLITGGTGLLGGALLRTVPQGAEVLWTSSRSASERCVAADIREYESVERVLNYCMPNAVIHAAAVGNVDQAEQNPEEVGAVNVGGTKNLTELCAKREIRLIFLSTNAVFDGKHPPYGEEDPVCPLSRYGAMKVEGEKLVSSLGDRGAVVRPIMMYGWPPSGGRDNAVSWWVKSLREKKEIKVVDNVFSMPLWVDDGAVGVWKVVEGGYSGIFHLAGQERVSLHEFALLAAEVFELDRTLISPVPDTHFKTLAPRPRDTSFCLDKARAVLGFSPRSLREGLLSMKSCEELL